MKILLTLITLSLVACGAGGGGDGSDSSAIPTPDLSSPPSQSSPAPNITWTELSGACTEVVPGFLWARYETAISRIYIFESLNFCQNFTSMSSLTLNSDQCGFKSSFQYGAWHFCNSSDPTNLSSGLDAWLTQESL